jgi:hypothetical protein
MLNWLNISHNLELEDGSNRIIRRSHDAVPGREDHFDAVLDHWRESRGLRGLLPGHDAIDPMVLHRTGLIGCCNIIDVSPDDPANYSARLWGTRITFDGGRSYQGRTVGSLQNPFYSHWVAIEYSGAKMLAVPLRQTIDANLDFRRSSYDRLILPFAADGRHVDRLLLAVRYRTP